MPKNVESRSYGANTFGGLLALIRSCEKEDGFVGERLACRLIKQHPEPRILMGDGIEIIVTWQSSDHADCDYLISVFSKTFSKRQGKPTLSPLSHCETASAFQDIGIFPHGGLAKCMVLGAG